MNFFLKLRQNVQMMHKQLFVLSILFLIILFIYSFGIPSKPSLSIDFHQQDKINTKFNEESYRFSRLEYYNQTRKRSENVIVYLVASFIGDIRLAYNPYPRLREKINLLDQRFHDDSTTDLIIFHTGYPFRNDILPIIEFTTRSVEFVNIDQIFYKFSPGFSPHMTDPNWTIKGKWNYHHMCYFWFKQVFELSIMQRYRFMMRLDDDSQILGKWPNIFNLMVEHQALYLANGREIDYEYVLPGLSRVRNLTADFIIKNKINVRNRDMLDDIFNHTIKIPNYWNNIEVIDLSFMKRKEVVDFIQTVDESKGIFLYRWGDATLRYITLALFANASQILHREKLKLGYCHPC